MSQESPERRGAPPPPPNNKARAAKRKQAVTDTPKRPRGRPPKVSQGERPDELAHLPPEDPKRKPKVLVRPDGEIDAEVLLDLYLMNATQQEIQDAFGVSPDNFKTLLKQVSNDTLIYIDDVLGQLTLKNIARTERLMRTWFPSAQSDSIYGASEKAAKIVIGLVQLERDLIKDAREEIKARTDQSEAGVDNLDDHMAVIDRSMEITFSRNSPLYAFSKSLGAGGEELTEFTEVVVNSDIAPALEKKELDIENLLKKLEIDSEENS